MMHDAAVPRALATESAYYGKAIDCRKQQSEIQKLRLCLTAIVTTLIHSSLAFVWPGLGKHERALDAAAISISCLKDGFEEETLRYHTNHLYRSPGRAYLFLEDQRVRHRKSE